MSYKIDNGLCATCDNCIPVCPVNAITYFENFDDHGYKLDLNKCIECGKCAEICPLDAINKY